MELLQLVPHFAKGIIYLITFEWQPSDDVFHLSSKFNGSVVNILAVNNFQNNFSSAVYSPIFGPCILAASANSCSTSTSTPSVHNSKESKHLWTIVGISLGYYLLITLSLVLLVYVCRLRKEKKTLGVNNTSPGTADKLISGVSGYASKPKVYDINVIMEATMNLNELSRIGGSVYRGVRNSRESKSCKSGEINGHVV
ncbi:Nod-factor receptor 5 [Quillaja saponaria]|uniref:Nod-factor receptor 5 n=1 Tax=Quillaja saponaria TaxID=32244 RepID=A0AAD7L7C5_QUISA|nr:Nod-factor receptor 5 [Quillaja saponaria]